MKIHTLDTISKNKNDENNEFLSVGGGSTHTGVLKPKPRTPISTSQVIGHAKSIEKSNEKENSVVQLLMYKNGIFFKGEFYDCQSPEGRRILNNLNNGQNNIKILIKY